MSSAHSLTHVPAQSSRYFKEWPHSSDAVNFTRTTKARQQRGQPRPLFVNFRTNPAKVYVYYAKCCLKRRYYTKKTPQSGIYGPVVIGLTHNQRATSSNNPGTGYQIYFHIFVASIVSLIEKTENKCKRGRGWTILRSKKRRPPKKLYT